MKIPENPPDFIKYLKNNEELILKTIKSSITDHKGSYLHWDKLRHLEPPEELSNEEWWAGIKFNRTKSYKKISLKNKYGAPFKFCITDSIKKHLKWLDMNPAETISAINKKMQNTYLIKSSVEEAINSSQLEGASTTGKEAKEMIRQGRNPKDKSEQMILNNYHAMQFIKEYKDENLTPSIICELHKNITEETLDDPNKAGILRIKEDDICVKDKLTSNILHYPPDASCLEKRLEQLCEFANGNSDPDFVHPVIRAIILHFMLSYDHPFVDGNGRTARALFYWSMISQGYWLAEFISLSRIIKNAPAQYDKAFLHTETDDNDLTYFIIHQLEVVKKAITDFNNYLEKKRKDHTQKILNDSKIVRKLNFRQIALINHALKHPGFIYKIKEHKNSHGISYETARKDLIYMSDKLKLLTKLKHGRSFIFVSPYDLENRIKSCGG